MHAFFLSVWQSHNSEIIMFVSACSYEQLPINQPKCPFHLNSEAGSMNFSHDNGEVGPHHPPGSLRLLTCCFPSSVAATHGSWCIQWQLGEGNSLSECSLQFKRTHESPPLSMIALASPLQASKQACMQA